MTFNEFLSEFKNSMKQYDRSNLIDDITVYTWVLDGISHFGLMPTINIEKIINIKNKKGSLPDGFKSLKLALKCEPYGYYTEEDSKDLLQSIYTYTVKTTDTTSWNNCDPCDTASCESTIVEKTYLHTGKPIEFYYRNPQLLSLTPYIKKEVCDKDCVNFKVKNSKYEININGKTIYTNFKDGNIFIVYRGYEEDDEGFVIIPDTDRGWFKEYLMYKCKRMLMEELMTNSDNTTNEATLYQIFLQNEREAFANAKTEFKFKNIKIGLSKYKKELKKEFSIYNFGNNKNLLKQSGITFLVT